MMSLYGHKVDGSTLAKDVFCYPVDKGACKSLVAEQTEGMSRDQLAAYAADILLGVLTLKQEVVNMRLFGKKDPRS